MPTYIYECAPCERQLELVLKIADRDNQQSCPDCGQTMTRPPVCPAVLTASYPDGTHRFDALREVRRLDKEIKLERDKKRKAKLKEEQKKVSKESAA